MLPTKAPNKPKGNKVKISLKLIWYEKKYHKKLTKDNPKIIITEVAWAFLGLTPNFSSKGTVKIPPPAPKAPLKNPEIIAPKIYLMFFFNFKPL